MNNNKNNIKVLLVNPPSDGPNPILPLGLAYIAAACEKAGMMVKVIDAWVENYSYTKIGELSKEYNPDIVGITIMSPVYAIAMRTVDVIRKHVDAPIVLGGPHPSAEPTQCLEDNPNADYVVIGEGDFSFVKLIRAVICQTQELCNIEGIAYRDGDKIIRKPEPDIEDLDVLPLPARHLFPVYKYKTHPPYGKSRHYLTMISSRGCPYRCTYCSSSVFGKKFRYASARHVVDEIKHLIATYGTREIHFYDDDFTLHKKRAAEVCELLIKENVKIDWSCTTRVNLVNPKLLSLMKKSGCWMISYGIETADPEILITIQKGYTNEIVEKAFKWTKKAGIRTVAFLMVGLPGESKESIKRTVNFAKKVNPDFVSWGVNALYPGSPMYEQAKQGKLYGGVKVDVRYSYEDKGSWSASGSPFGEGYSVIYEDRFTREEMKDIAQKHNLEFYLRPSYLVKLIFKIRSWYEFKHYAKGGLMVVIWALESKLKPLINLKQNVRISFSRNFN